MEKKLNLNTVLLAIVLALSGWELKQSVESGKNIAVLQSNVNELTLRMTEMTEFRNRLTTLEIELGTRKNSRQP